MLWRSFTSAELSSPRSIRPGSARTESGCWARQAQREEALAYAGTLPPDMYGLTVSKV